MLNNLSVIDYLDLAYKQISDTGFFVFLNISGRSLSPIAKHGRNTKTRS